MGAGSSLRVAGSRSGVRGSEPGGGPESVHEQGYATDQLGGLDRVDPWDVPAEWMEAIGYRLGNVVVASGWESRPGKIEATGIASPIKGPFETAQPCRETVTPSNPTRVHHFPPLGVESARSIKAGYLRTRFVSSLLGPILGHNRLAASLTYRGMRVQIVEEPLWKSFRMDAPGLPRLR